MKTYQILITFSFLLFLGGCSTRGKGAYNNKIVVPSSQYQQDTTISSTNRSENTTIYSSDTNNYSTQIDAKSHKHPTMRPYVVRGVKYYPTVVQVGDTFSGRASWYGPDFHGKLTSNGERYNMFKMTAAHKTLPMNTIVKVTNRTNGLSAVVRINDRGPFVNTRIIDLSKKAADAIKMIGTGTAPVTLEIIGFDAQSNKALVPSTSSAPSTKKLKRAVEKKSISNFYLQIASFSNVNGAIKTQEKYAGIDGYKTIIKDVERGNGRIFKVMIKGFKSKEEALDYKKKSIFKNAFIVKED
jgi:rare lipoprotein A